MKQLIAILFAIFIFCSCSKYGKILKNPDPEVRYEAAVSYYNDGDYFKALPLLEDLIDEVRGTERAQDVFYLYAQTHFGIGDYTLANYYFKNFVKTYPKSKYTEECLFLAAMCSFSNSPNYSLDQGNTRNAIDEFQYFMDEYPSSELRDSCNTMISTLRSKLEKKAFEVAALYLKTERYKSAAIALSNTLVDYPDTRYREEIMFMIIEANYLLAINSIEVKKLERFEETTKSYYTFVAAFPESKTIKQAERYFEASLREIDKLKGNLVEQ